MRSSDLGSICGEVISIKYLQLISNPLRNLRTPSDYTDWTVFKGMASQVPAEL